MNPETLSLIGILIATTFFVLAVFKGYHVTFVSIVSSVIVAAFSQVNIITALTSPSEAFMGRFSSTYGSYFLLFFFSAFFAKSLGDVGASQAIAFKIAKLARKWPGHEMLMAILALILIQSVFTYGGISLFVVTFTVLYIAKNLFEELNVPWRLYTLGSIGTSCFTTGYLPGSPQLTNLIPMDYFKTPATAAPVLSIVCSLFCFVLCWCWVVRQVNIAKKRGEGFAPSGSELLASWDKSKDVAYVDLPLFKCLLPSIVLIGTLNVFKFPPVISLVCGTFTSYALFGIRKQFANMKSACMVAVQNANQALVALASAAAFGGMVASVSGFDYILNAVGKIPGPPVFQIIISLNVAAGFSASSSTGQKLALDMLGERFMSFGIPNAALHRLVSISSLGLDTLPHSSSLANTYYMCKLSYKDSYINNFMVTVIFNLLSAVFCGILINMGLTF